MSAPRTPDPDPGIPDPDPADLADLAELAELEALEAWLSGGAAPEPVPQGPPPGGWFPCPACGHQMFGELMSSEICEVCFWEEDPWQLRYPWADVGANGGVSLIRAQQNYRRLGAVREDVVRHVRPPADDEPLDPGWRPLDPDLDPYERETSRTPSPEDLTALYYWRPGYWRAHLRRPRR